MLTPTPADASFEYQVTVKAEDIDGLRHTNNACYATWCEQAAWQHSQELGITLSDFERLDRAMAIRHAEYDYRYSTYQADKLSIKTWLEPSSATQMKRYFDIKRQQDQLTVLTANWLLVCIQISTGKAKRLPNEFRAAYLGDRSR